MEEWLPWRLLQLKKVAIKGDECVGICQKCFCFFLQSEVSAPALLALNVIVCFYLVSGILLRLLSIITLEESSFFGFIHSYTFDVFVYLERM